MGTGLSRGSWIIATLLAVGGCEPATGPSRIAGLPRELTASEQAVVRANNRFAFGMLSELNRVHADSNIFFSPLGASMALGMTMNGAAGETFEAMRSALGFDALSQDEINASYRGLIDLLRGLDPRVQFLIANSIWYRQGFQIEPAFLDVTRRVFDAEVAGLNFSDPAAADVINAWVDRATQGRISEIVSPPIDPLTMVFLINAIYFKGTWTYRFDPGKTRPAPFTREDGSTVPVMMMELEATVPYAVAWPDYEVVDLPYGGEAFAMTVVLPAPGVGVDSLMRSLDAQRWDDLAAQVRDVELRLFLPRFRLEWEHKLKGPLSALGMGVAFDPGRADFTPMYRFAREAGVHIKDVKQKTFVDVNEEGTEAAAVTKVEVGIVCACGPRTVRVDRPFLFAIRERFSGTVLFVGKVMEPPESGGG